MTVFNIKPKAFYDRMQDAVPSQPYSYDYGDRPTFTFHFLPDTIAEGDLLVFAVDNDMVFYDAAPENILHSATCMVVCKHEVTGEEAIACSVDMRIETRTVKFRDVVNGKVRPLDVVSGLYLKHGSGQDINYVLLAKARAFANGIIADYDSLPEPITIDDYYYTKTEINSLLDEKADEDDFNLHVNDTDIHVTLQDKSTWDSKADLNDIPTEVSQLNNDSNYQTEAQVSASISTAIANKADKSELPTNVSELTNDADYQTGSEVADSISSAIADKADKSELPTTVSELTNDAGYQTQAEVSATVSAAIADKADRSEIPTVVSQLTNDATYQTEAQVSATVSAAVAPKADSSSVYTKTETDALLGSKADVATTLSGYGITDAYTKTEIDTKIASVYRYKGTVATYADLPSSGQEVGDVYNVETADTTHGIKAGDNVAWNGTAWDVLAGEIVFPEQEQADWNESDSSDVSFIKNKPVIGDATVTINQGGISKGTFTLNQTSNATIDLNDGAQSDWNESDSSKVSYILNKPDVEPKIDDINEYFEELYSEPEPVIPDDHFELCIAMDNPAYTQGIRFYCQFSTSTWNINMQYSYDRETWYDFEFSDTPELGFSSTAWMGEGYPNSHMYIRGNNDSNYFALAEYFVFNTVNNEPECAVSVSSNLYSIFRKENFWEITDFTQLGGYAQYGCYSLFRNTDGDGKYLFNCNDAGALILPAVRLKQGQYNSMFRASKIEIAPHLPANTLVTDCYANMFRDCTELRRMSVGFTKFNNATGAWVSGVGAEGEFYCPAALPTTSTGDSGIPTGWTVKYF